jgi:hypothetical protein
MRINECWNTLLGNERKKEEIARSPAQRSIHSVPYQRLPRPQDEETRSIERARLEVEGCANRLVPNFVEYWLLWGVSTLGMRGSRVSLSPQLQLLEKVFRSGPHNLSDGTTGYQVQYHQREIDAILPPGGIRDLLNG